MRRVALSLAFAALASVAQAQGDSNWKNLEQLKPGENVEIVLKSKAKHRGTFAMLAEDAITVRGASGEAGYRRDEVARVSRMGPARRGRAALIGLAIGGLAGAAALGAAADWVINPAAAAAVGGVVFGAAGAGVGAAVAQPHRDVLYRAP